jgi:hypothetical protein
MLMESVNRTIGREASVRPDERIQQASLVGLRERNES